MLFLFFIPKKREGFFIIAEGKMNQCQFRNLSIRRLAHNTPQPVTTQQYELYITVTSAYTATLRYTQVSDDETTIDWGDGSATQTSGTGTTVAITHSYAVGSYTLTIDSDNMADIALYGTRDDDDCYNCLSLYNASISLTSITIPSGVTNIGSRAFYGCTGLTSVTIPSGVTSIGGIAFYGCTGLTSITIPSGVTSIGANTFNGCTGLTSITIPSSVTNIGDRAFYGCTGLTSITIPSSVTNIGSRAFNGCTGLTSVTFNPITPPTINSSTFYSVPSTGTVYVPTGTASAYTTALSSTGLSGWTIVEQ